jgi:hypothetical protein
MRGDFYWTAGQQVKIVVGQLGRDHNQWRGGGGASWVTNMSNEPFIVAGGGGGGSGTTYKGHGRVAPSGQDGVTSSVGGGCANTQNPGGQNGQGGSGQGFSGGNSGGGGLSTAGGASLAGVGGGSFVSGALGGVGYAGCEGGFGGGGACIGHGGCPAGGGGGGYSGGGGASGEDAASGGGGSWNTGANQLNLGGENAGEGYVQITLEVALLDNVAARASCVAAYGTKHLLSSYIGPTVRCVRAIDGSQQDFYADSTGNLSTIQGTQFATWVSGTSANLVTWYDQTGRGRHLSATTATRPSIIASDSNAVYLTSDTLLSSANVFDTSSVSAMHIVTSTREIGRIHNGLINLNGAADGLNRFSTHMPWTDGTWYWDPWDNNVNNRAMSPANLTAVGQKSVFSGYMGGFRVNRGTTYTSPQNTAASVAGGLRVGAYASWSANHYMYNLLIFNERLSASDETTVETNV